MTSEINPETGTTTYVYDADGTCGTYAGNLVKRTDAVGNVTCYAYDSLHRLTSTTYRSGSYSATTPKKNFVYDATTVNGVTVFNTKGRLAEAYTCTGTCASKVTDLWYSYSKRGEVADAYEVTPHSGGSYHITQSYWEHGGVKVLAGLPGLPTITYGATDGSGLDGEGRITKVTASSGTNPLTAATYTASGTAQPIGSLTALTLGSSDTDNFSYDINTGRMTQYKFNIGATPQSVVGTLTWNANGSLRTLAIADPFNSPNAQTCTFTYDDLARQSTANCGTAWNQTFSFDPFGNINKSATVGTSFNATYSTSTNRITTIGSLVPTYDANGNLTNDTSHAYTWDAEGRMLTVDSGTSSGVCDTYDALGRMIEKAAGTSCTSSYTEIVYAPSGGRLATMTGQTLQQASVPLIGGAEAVYNGSGLLAYRHSDQLGSSRFASTPSRTKYFDVAYAPYGEDYASSGTSDLSFTGQKKDTASWLYDFMYRKYNAADGRWMSPDPTGIGAADPRRPQTWNRYAYVSNTPLSNLDRGGLLPIPSCTQDGTCPGPMGGGDGLDAPTYVVDGIEMSSEVAGIILGTDFGTECPAASGCTWVNGHGEYSHYVAFANGGGAYAYLGPGALYYSATQAGIAAGLYYEGDSATAHQEHGGKIFEDATLGVFSYTEAITGPPCGPTDTCVIDPGQYLPVPDGAEGVGEYHTHPYDRDASQFELDEFDSARFMSKSFTDIITTPDRAAFSINGQLYWQWQLGVPGSPRPTCQLRGPQMAGISACP